MGGYFVEAFAKNLLAAVGSSIVTLVRGDCMTLNAQIRLGTSSLLLWRALCVCTTAYIVEGREKQILQYGYANCYSLTCCLENPP